ncbi:hypothetical protein [Nocardia sp. XZ_19_231]|uniref:hypothetical protein n=1 Tax=Nocardia sp. XZ_19_231 TaxID=2769252 RepID=UPI0018906532|nr:hypothetical protein [Nocardia sp. XZ_19_231]
MTAFSTRTRRAALALLGGAAVITATSAGIATAEPGAPSHGDERTTIICTDPGGGVPDLPPLTDGPDIGFHHAVPDGPRVEFRHVAPGEPGRLPAPGNVGPRVDGPVECTRIDPDGGRTIVIAPREFSETAPAPGSGSADSIPAHPF